MSAFRPRLSAAVTVVLGIATGLVTMLVTDEWTWALGAACAVLVAAGLVFAVLGTGSPQRRMQVAETTGSGSTISGGRVDVSGGAHVRVLASGRDRIADPSTAPHGADGEHSADDGEIPNVAGA